MIHIIKRNIPAYLLLLFGSVTALAVVKGLIGTSPSTVGILACGVIIFITALFGVMIPEQYEEKHKGYDLMAALPLRSIDIIMAKMFPPLILVAALTSLALLIWAGAHVSPANAAAIRSFLLLSGAGGLAVIGMIYVGIFLIGYTKFLLIFFSFTTALGFAPILVLRSGNSSKLFSGIYDFLAAASSPAIILSAALFYALLFFLSTFIKKYSR